MSSSNIVDTSRDCVYENILYVMERGSARYQFLSVQYFDTHCQK